MAKLSIRDLDLKNKRVFIRVDFNVPLDEHGRVTDDTRIVETLPTIDYALQHRAHVILASHLGRPKGKPNPKMSLRPVAEHLRFHPEEEANDEKFSKSLAKLAELYVNDAFGSAHRAHASTAGINKFVSKSAAGLLMEKELQYLGKVLANPERPFIAILGGAKVSDKIEVIRNLMPKVDALLIGGAMAYTFMKAQGREVGKSLVEDDKLELARQLLAEAKTKGLTFLLPAKKSLRPKRFCGTARWGSSKSLHSPKVRLPSPKRSRRILVRLPSSAAAIPLPPCSRQAWPIKSVISPPAAARH